MIEITTIMGNSSAPALSPYAGCAEVSVPFMSGKSIRQRLAPDVGEKGAGCASCASHAEGEELVREPEPYPRLPKTSEPAHVPLAGHGRAFEMHASEARPEQPLQTSGRQGRDMGRIVPEAGPATLPHRRAEIEEPLHRIVRRGQGEPPPGPEDPGSLVQARRGRPGVLDHLHEAHEVEGALPERQSFRLRDHHGE